MVKYSNYSSIFLLSILGIVSILGILTISLISNSSNLVGFAAGGKNSYQCSDHRDNDGDGFCDYAAGRNSYCSDGSKLGDKDCSSKSDNTELGPIVIDSDGDGFDSTVDCNDFDASKWKIIQAYKDNDNEGYTVGSLQQLCSGNSLPSGYRSSSLGSDCNDYDSAIYPGAVEICDNIDNDCDGLIDNIASTSQSCTISNSYGTCSGVTTTSCSAGSLVLSDCSAKTPLLEICGNGVDEDCNGTDLTCTTTIGGTTGTGLLFSDDFVGVTLGSVDGRYGFVGWSALNSVNVPHFKFQQLEYQSSSNYGEIVYDSTKNKHVFKSTLRYSDGTRARIQWSNDIDGLKSPRIYHYSYDMWIHPDVQYLENWNSSGISWYSISEMWLDNLPGYSEASARWSTYIDKDRNDVDKDNNKKELCFKFESEKMSPADVREQRLYPDQYVACGNIPFGRWFTFDLYWNQDTGKVIMKVDQNIVMDITGGNVYPGYEDLRISWFTPIKHYVGNSVFTWMDDAGKNMTILYDNYKWYN